MKIKITASCIVDSSDFIEHDRILIDALRANDGEKAFFTLSLVSEKPPDLAKQEDNFQITVEEVSP